MNMGKKLFRISALLICLVMLFSICCSCKGDVTDNSSVTQSIVSSETTSIDDSDETESELSSSVESSVTSSNVVIDSVTRDRIKPVSLTVSLYDPTSGVCGFNWNSEIKPKEPVVQVCEGKVFDESKCKEYPATVTSFSVTRAANAKAEYYYISKAQVPLKANTNYVYRAYDKYAKIGSEPAVFKTGNPKASSFTFAHISDTQIATSENDTMHYAAGTGKDFEQVLKGIKKSASDAAFLLHTGDIVQYSYESYWDNMIDYNFKYLSGLPIMPAAGNHDTSEYKGKDVIVKHFNLNAPQQNAEKGLFYYFDYGDVRFIVINTNAIDSAGKLEQTQYNSIKRTLESNTKKWTIVSMHNPMFSVGKWGQNDEQNGKSLIIRDQLYKLFARYNVDLVLQGHDHTYSKTYPVLQDGSIDNKPEYETIGSVKYTVNPKGVIYAVHGTSGDQSRKPYGVTDENIYEIYGESHNNSWANITVENNKLTVKIMYLENGQPKLWNSYGILKK